MKKLIVPTKRFVEFHPFGSSLLVRQTREKKKKSKRQKERRKLERKNIQERKKALQLKMYRDHAEKRKAKQLKEEKESGLSKLAKLPGIQEWDWPVKTSHKYLPKELAEVQTVEDKFYEDMMNPMVDGGAEKVPLFGLEDFHGDVSELLEKLLIINENLDKMFRYPSVQNLDEAEQLIDDTNSLSQVAETFLSPDSNVVKSIVEFRTQFEKNLMDLFTEHGENLYQFVSNAEGKSQKETEVIEHLKHRYQTRGFHLKSKDMKKVLQLSQQVTQKVRGFEKQFRQFDFKTFPITGSRYLPTELKERINPIFFKGEHRVRYFGISDSPKFLEHIIDPIARIDIAADVRNHFTDDKDRFTQVVKGPLDAKLKLAKATGFKSALELDYEGNKINLTTWLEFMNQTGLQELDLNWLEKFNQYLRDDHRRIKKENAAEISDKHVAAHNHRRGEFIYYNKEKTFSPVHVASFFPISRCILGLSQFCEQFFNATIEFAPVKKGETENAWKVRKLQIKSKDNDKVLGAIYFNPFSQHDVNLKIQHGDDAKPTLMAVSMPLGNIHLPHDPMCLSHENLRKFMREMGSAVYQICGGDQEFYLADDNLSVNGKIFGSLLERFTYGNKLNDFSGHKEWNIQLFPEYISDMQYTDPLFKVLELKDTVLMHILATEFAQNPAMSISTRFSELDQKFNQGTTLPDLNLWYDQKVDTAWKDFHSQFIASYLHKERGLEEVNNLSEWWRTEIKDLRYNLKALSSPKAFLDDLSVTKPDWSDDVVEILNSKRSKKTESQPQMNQQDQL